MRPLDHGRRGPRRGAAPGQPRREARPHLPSDAGFGTDDADYLASEGFNTLRLGFDYAAVEPGPDAFDDAFVAAIDAEAEASGQSGLFVLADVHQDMFTDRFQGNGMPDWMAIDDGQMNAPLVGFPGNYFFGNAALRRSFDNWWANADALRRRPRSRRTTRRAAAPRRRDGGRRAAARLRRLQRALAGNAVAGVQRPDGCAGPARSTRRCSATSRTARSPRDPALATRPASPSTSPT